MPEDPSLRRPGRKRNVRKVGCMPRTDFFKPRGIPLIDLDVNTITHEELEAVRLIDLLGMDQESGARRMGISRKSLYKDLRAGRKKIAQALVEGRAILIEGGSFELRRGSTEGIGDEEEIEE